MSLPHTDERHPANLGSPEFTSRPIRTHPVIKALFKGASNKPQSGQRCWFGWGRKASGQTAQEKARQHAEPFCLLEDGFIRSVERQDSPLSLLVDDLGIYYDATVPSRLENLIPQPLSQEQEVRADALIQQWKTLQVSKYNASPEYSGELPTRYVLVIDQVAGDSSIAFGLASQDSFDSALDAALTEHPNTKVLVKVHPDAFTRSKCGHFNLDQLRTNSRIQIINEACHPVELIKHSAQVYVVTSQMGFEALIWGKKVSCFGTPFYSGWGLTDDRGSTLERRCHEAVSLQQLIFSALVKYAHYANPETGALCEVETVISWISLQRKMRERFQHLKAPMCAIGFSRWKKPFIRQFLSGNTISFSKNKDKCPGNAVAVIWGSNKAPSSCKGTLRIEDGFLRSSGLGADLVRPLSWVIDDIGIYYDATRPSRLEKILSEHQWSESTLERADRLRQTIVDNKLSKYNLSGAHWQRPVSDEKQVILVPGQVPSDASINLGCQNIRNNVDLLRTVRNNNPNAYIVYKPHPDVVAGLRKKDNNWKELKSLCDEIVTDADGMQMLEQVDEIHTMTSLMGFEALIRNKKVYCYGQPFYSGWGLTTDHSINARRNRILSVRQLCAGVLINYPTYVSKNSTMYTTPEMALNELHDWRQAGPTSMPLWRKGIRIILRMGKR